jgi:hypothetical protein
LIPNLLLLFSLCQLQPQDLIALTLRSLLHFPPEKFIDDGLRVLSQRRADIERENQGLLRRQERIVSVKLSEIDSSACSPASRAPPLEGSTGAKNPAPRWPVRIAHALGPQRGQKKKARQINPGRGKNGGSRVDYMAQLCFRRVSSWRSFGFVLPPGPFICARRSCTSRRGSGMGCTGWRKRWSWRRHARLPGDEVFDLTSSERHLFAASRQLRPSTVGDRVHN